jgi:hypothetical protein
VEYTGEANSSFADSNLLTGEADTDTPSGLRRLLAANATSDTGVARGDLASAGSTWSGLYMLKLGGNQFTSSVPEVYYRTVGAGVCAGVCWGVLGEGVLGCVR